MSVKDGIEEGEYGFPEYREAIQLYVEEHRRSYWLRAEIQVEVPHEGEGPSITDCRFAAMRIYSKGYSYVVYDRLLSRIVDGVYFGKEDGLKNALGVAQWYNEGGKGYHRSCNGEALGLVYPNKRNLPEWDGTWKSKDWDDE